MDCILLCKKNLRKVATSVFSYRGAIVLPSRYVSYLDNREGLKRQKGMEEDKTKVRLFLNGIEIDGARLNRTGPNCRCYQLFLGKNAVEIIKNQHSELYGQWLNREEMGLLPMIEIYVSKTEPVFFVYT